MDYLRLAITIKGACIFLLFVFTAFGIKIESKKPKKKLPYIEMPLLKMRETMMKELVIVFKEKCLLLYLSFEGRGKKNLKSY